MTQHIEHPEMLVHAGSMSGPARSGNHHRAGLIVALVILAAVAALIIFGGNQ